MIVAVAQGLGNDSGTAGPFCGVVLSMQLYVALCRMAPLLRVFFHSRLLLALWGFCPRWTGFRGKGMISVFSMATIC